MKTRVNSKINNVKHKKKRSNNTLSKIQGYYSTPKRFAVGYCAHHSMNIGQKLYDMKKCKECPHFIKYVKGGDLDVKNKINK